MKAMSSYFTPIPIPIFSIIPHLLPVPTFQPGNMALQRQLSVRFSQQWDSCWWTKITASNLLNSSNGPALILGTWCWYQCACPLREPGATSLPSYSRSQPRAGEQSAWENSFDICLQYILSTLLAGRPNGAFFFFQDSKMNHTFCLRSSIYVSLEMWSLFSLLQTWARCFSVVHIYEYGFLSLFPFLSPPPFFFSSSLTFLSFSCSVWIYGSSQTKGICFFCRRKVVRGKALRSSVLSGDYFHINVSRCPLSAIVLSRECFMFWELQIVLV